MTPAQAQVIPLDRIARFFSSDLYRRMKASQRLEQELRFLWEVGSEWMGYENAGSDKITVQGWRTAYFGKKAEW